MTFSLTRRAIFAAAVALTASLSAPFTAAAAEGPLTIVVPYAAGGTNDAFARMLGEGMGKQLGRTVFIENKPGANGIIGATFVSRAKPDGNTLFFGGTGPISLNTMMRPTLPYKLEDFASVAMLFDGTLTITVPTSLGVNSLAELVEKSKSENRAIRYGTLGPGSVTDLYGVIFGKTLGVETRAVAYKNNPSSLVDLIGGQAEMSNATPIALSEYARSGDLKILALTTAERDPAFPDVPSVAELGYPELQASYWTSLHAPKGTDPEVIAELAEAAIKAVQSDSFRELLSKNGQYERAGGPAALDAQLALDKEIWGKIIEEQGLALK